MLVITSQISYNINIKALKLILLILNSFRFVFFFKCLVLLGCLLFEYLILFKKKCKKSNKKKT